MIKYICDICESEITSEGESEVIGLRLGALDFTNKVLHLCDSCHAGFKEAKESLYNIKQDMMK